ncbi:MAG: hypothetical protein RIQ46_1212 [Pseudomonadota bacterium]
MIPLIVIRPEPGCAASLAAARAMGLEAHGFPLFSIAALPWQAPPAESFDAVLLGSANALRHGGAELAACRGKPAYAVGEATAAAARAAGLDVVATGRGGLQGLMPRLDPAHRRLLRLCGQERVALEPPPGVSIVERVVYASEALPLPGALAELLRRPAVVALHSAEAARHFAGLCADRGPVRLACIGPRVSEAAGTGWAAVEAAPVPDDAALLALAARMCQEGSGEKTGI